jgi:septal ring factor EnvC (AmiA/AmiB activator)
VTSRIEKISINRGTVVRKGDTIGIMGDTATLFDEGLYFEMRHGRESLDPLLWLAPNNLSKLYEH